jgi:LysM repeat protein
VEPGDTLTAITRTFSSGVSTVITANPGAALTRLQVGQILIIPVGLIGGSTS